MNLSLGLDLTLGTGEEGQAYRAESLLRIALHCNVRLRYDNKPMAVSIFLKFGTLGPWV